MGDNRDGMRIPATVETRLGIMTVVDSFSATGGTLVLALRREQPLGKRAFWTAAMRTTHEPGDMHGPFDSLAALAEDFDARTAHMTRRTWEGW
jgi:hypothetical protein